MTDEKETFRDEFNAIATTEGVDPGYVDNYYNLVFELATGLASRAADGLLTIGIAGAQGTGKTTFSKMLAILLERVFEKSTLVLSLDDFYLTRAERTQLAKDVHPLLAVRGVPGTHDVPLMRSVVSALKAGRNVEVPAFSKADDDRVGTTPVMGASLDVLIAEGWCWGATPAFEESLSVPVNELEREQDPDGDWRWFVNDRLASAGYQALFAEADATFFLAAPDMDTVYRWRWQQEKRLQGSGGSHVMSEDEMRRFIMYYERITLRMLEQMPATADLTIFLDENHRVKVPRRDQFPS
ncbi:MAG: kinase [Gammaproteobacteria bacterium]|nr:kinase [Gammaproteobacteria bacterium]